MSQWSGGADSGILRNKGRGSVVGEGKPEELLVFGYACKLFRDDEKAKSIDQGKHLIPWMGDESLKIDRYDGRGTLSDLKQYEASREGYDTIRWLGLSESERKLEELCDTERYYSLEINEEEEELYKEEDVKRRLTNAFQYSYNENGSAPTPKTIEPEGIPTVPEFNEDEQPYIASPLLDVPVDISVPKTIKEYARIEKTALFVCRQGQQMEILIKTKQSDNPQFSFLTQSDALYKFYRHVLSAFKNGRYQPQYNKKSDQEKQDSDKLDEQNENHYLHPSLVSSKSHLDQSQVSSSVAASTTSTLTFEPSANCAYSQLVTKIQGTTTPVQQPEQVPAQLSAEQQQYYQYYYLQQYYDYYRQMLQNGQNGAQYAGLPHDFHQLDAAMQNFVHQLAYSQYVQHCQQKPEAPQPPTVKQDSNSYAQIVSNLNKDGVNPYAANVPQLPVKLENKKNKQDEPKTDEISGKNEIKEVVAVKKSLLSLAAAYGSGSDTEESEDEENSGKSSQSQSESDEKEIVKPKIKIPGADTQVIVDKMADYVFKNGAQFEDIIREKNDTRFDFLKSDHEFHEYYKSKLRELRGEPEPELSPTKEKLKKTKRCKPKKIIAPVSFSIKKPKEEPPKEIKSALPLEESSDEDASGQEKKQSQNLPNDIDNTSSLLSSSSGTIYNIQDQSVPQKLSHILEGTMTPKDSAISSVNGKSETEELKEQKKKKDKIIENDDVIDISDSSDNKEKKVDHKIKDKLAAVAREKLASVTREKALQLERKRKAAAFLKLKLQNENAANSDPSALSSILLTNFKQQGKTPKKITEERLSTDSSVGNEPIFEDIPLKKKSKEDHDENQDIPTKNEDRTDEEVQKRLENVLEISISTTERTKSSESNDSSSGDCEIVGVSFPKRQKKRSRSRSGSKDRSRSKEKKRHKEKKRKRSDSPKTDDRNKRKKDKKKKSHRRKHGKSSQDIKHRKKLKKHRRSRSKSPESLASS